MDEQPSATSGTNGEIHNGVEAPAAAANTLPSTSAAPPASQPIASTSRGQKRSREVTSLPPTAAPPPPAEPSPLATARRFESIIFGGFEIRPQFPSPYPLEDASTASGAGPADKRGGLSREQSGKFTSKATNGADLKGKKKAVVVGKRKGPAKSVTPELGLPAVVKAESVGGLDAIPTASEPVVKMEVDSPIGTDPTVVNETDIDSPAAADAFATDDDAIVAATLGVKPPLEVIMTSTSTSSDPPLPLAPVSLDPPAPATPAPAPPPLITDLDPAHPSPPVAEPTSASRGQKGRFLPKPPGESVRAKRQLEKAAKAAATPPTVVDPSAPVHLTVREQREINKKVREEREKEATAKTAGQPVATKRLFVCEGCFKYMTEPAAHTKHMKECTFKRPPGKKVYQRGAHTIWEVDGATEKLYCQNLCLFGKLFIEHKYMFFDLEGFVFYVMTDATPSRDWPLAYFSKEKVSYDDYNLACIVTFPPYRENGWATLLIEFSYEITRRHATSPGTPERPLSTLGEKGYLAYWTSVLVRYFRAVFAHRGPPPAIPIDLPSSKDLEGAPEEGEEDSRKKKSRRSRGWDGELGSTTLTLRRNSVGHTMAAALVPRSVEKNDRFAFPTSLTDVAEATNLRPDDAAFALVESGLAQWRRKTADDGAIQEEGEGEGGASEEQVLELIITPELVEEVATTKRVKPKPMLDLAYVML